MSLDEQIAEHSTTVQTQSYSMSLSELVAMYKDGELGLHPRAVQFSILQSESKMPHVVDKISMGTR